MSVSHNSLTEGKSAEQHSFAFRISLAASIGFTLGHLLGWDFPFLPSLLAVQLLSARRSLDLKRAFGFVPLMALSSLELAYALVHDLIVGSIIAALLTFLVHALFPSHPVAEQAPPNAIDESTPVRAALANTAVLMSLFVYF